MTSASLGIVHMVRHTGYISAWPEMLHEDHRAIVRAARCEQLLMTRARER